MLNLRMRDPETRAVLQRYDLTRDRLLGRGKFCAVYEDTDETVWKLTSSSLQLESSRDYFHGNHFPGFIESRGYVGEQRHGADLLLYKAERLNPLGQASFSTQKLAKLIIKKAKGYLIRHFILQRADVSSIVCEEMSQDQELPASVRSAFEDVLTLTLDYEGVALDLHTANLMVRGSDELILNDVVVLLSELETATSRSRL